MKTINKGDYFHTSSAQWVAIENEVFNKGAKAKCIWSNHSMYNLGTMITWRTSDLDFIAFGEHPQMPSSIGILPNEVIVLKELLTPTTSTILSNKTVVGTIRENLSKLKVGQTVWVKTVINDIAIKDDSTIVSVETDDDTVWLNNDDTIQFTSTPFTEGQEIFFTIKGEKVKSKVMIFDNKYYACNPQGSFEIFTDSIVTPI
jgi:hypothetical protein